jgi:hypothetical protein
MDNRSFEDVRADLERQLGPPKAQKAVDDLANKTPAVLDPDYFPKLEAK